MKKNKFLLIAFLLLVSNADGQQKIQGQVVEIIDGSTFVLEETNKSRFIVQLQYVEIPPDPVFSNVVKDHLSKLILNRKVEFVWKFTDNDRRIGKIVAGNIDLSQQLLRDGAAYLLQIGLQDEIERADYRKAESMAREEKRGVWGNPKLVESAEFHRQKAAREALYKEKMPDPNRRIFAGLEPTPKMSEKANKGLYIGMTIDAFIKICGEPPQKPELFTSEGYQSVDLRIPETKENTAKGCSGSFRFTRTSDSPVFTMRSALQDL